MSEFIATLHNTSIDKIDKISSISNLQLYSKYENAEYRHFIEELIGKVKETKNIDIYSIFLALTAEIFLNLNDIENISTIVTTYLKTIEDNFDIIISPIDQKQKFHLSEKGLNLLLSTLENNLKDMYKKKDNISKLSSLDIDSTNESLLKIITFFNKNDIKYDKNLEQKLNDIFANIKKLLETKKNSESKFKTVNVQKFKKTKSTDSNLLFKSHRWTTLIDKIDVLKRLIDDDRIFEAAVVYNDIQSLLVNFDPKEYFPEVFFPLYKKISPHIKNIHKNIDSYSESIQWSTAKKMYDIDYISFLEEYGKMPENNFINTPIAEDYFYRTSSESQNYQKEDNKIFDNNLIDQKDLNKPLKKSKKNLNTSTAENDLNDLADL